MEVDAEGDGRTEGEERWGSAYVDRLGLSNRKGWKEFVVTPALSGFVF